MPKIKDFIFKHFELLLIFLMVLAAELINFYLVSKLSFLNFFYLPVLLAGYYLGKRAALTTSVASVFLIGFFFLAWPDYISGPNLILDTFIDLGVWSFFLLLAGLLIGTLYEEKEKKVTQLKLAYVGILEILSKYLDSYDRHTQGHSVRVSRLATEIAIYLKLPRAIVENIRVAGLLHDIGKADISLDILQKSAKLSQEEKELIDRHTDHGAQILGLVGDVLKESIPIVQAHHMNYLNNEFKDVPLEARIISVADAYDAMVSDRPYRQAKTPWKAIEEIENDAGKKFDPAVVEGLKAIITQIAEDPINVPGLGL